MRGTSTPRRPVSPAIDIIDDVALFARVRKCQAAKDVAGCRAAAVMWEKASRLDAGGQSRQRRSGQAAKGSAGQLFRNVLAGQGKAGAVRNGSPRRHLRRAGVPTAEATLVQGRPCGLSRRCTPAQHTQRQKGKRISLEASQARGNMQRELSNQWVGGFCRR